ncbi:diguanylate cyclase [Bradyrhizobium centrolobii]|uniref:diguanylate cyclase n=1 Tax=Bradyrhizobium centrolobii TaxID=1505087 RepID=A0A176YIR4_9BRAD|nr:diguanylate cyclase [Bradyrhizobium centrolobii]OAF06071.1 diguanylate cyclase [Bradyrhizobium centrolobii]
MVLDLRTIYVVTSLTVALLGAVQLASYFIGRFGRWPLWWGLGNILTGFGSFCIAFRDLAPDVVTIDIGNSATVAGYVCMLPAVRLFANRPAHLRYVALAALTGTLISVLVLDGASGTRGRIIFGSLVCCIVDLVIAREGVLLGLRERLYSAWILVSLYLPTALIFAVRALLAATGEIGRERLFDGSSAHTALAVFAVLFIVLRNMVMMLMAAERNHHQLTAFATSDPLTGALNRAGLARAYGALGATRVTALLIDMDHFKALNDRHGHAAGDTLLRMLVEVVKTRLRPGDVVARLGGDEFVVLLADASLDDAARMAGGISKDFSDAISAHGTFKVHPTLSIGIARRSTAAMTLEALLQNADAALYRSKQQGRNRIEAHVEEPLAA